MPFIVGAIAFFALFSSPARTEILAMLNYESKAEQTIRREGIAGV